MDSRAILSTLDEYLNFITPSLNFVAQREVKAIYYTLRSMIIGDNCSFQGGGWRVDS